jgi:hypothetical protein
MARTILEIAQEAAQRDATAPAPKSLFNDNSKVARVLRHAAKDTMREYLRLVSSAGHSELQSTWTFSLRPRRFAYPLPPDFLRIIPRTEHRNGWEMGLVGPANAVTWARWLSGGGAVTAPMGWRIRNNMLMIEPIPDAAELVSIDYISRYPVVSEIRDGDYDLTAKPIRPMAPLVARDGYLDVASPSDVVTTAPDDAVYEDPDVGYEVGTWPEDLSEILRRINPASALSPAPMVRRPEFTADTDMPAWDDDYLLSLGMTFRLRRGLALQYAEVAAEYEAEMDAKANTDGGNARDFVIGSDVPQAETVPLGGGRWLLS